MPAAVGSGTLIYAKDLALLASFYRVLLSMSEVHASDELVVLRSHDGRSPQCELIVHRIPEHIAETIVVASPPVLREDTAIKPFFAVASFAEAAAHATSMGGGVFGPQYEGPGFRITNAYDPEGNIIQLREPIDGDRIAP
jgi:catechol 2,3-dioxygenase-like lactoylglutathione lyase family enzyme